MSEIRHCMTTGCTDKTPVTDAWWRREMMQVAANCDKLVQKSYLIHVEHQSGLIHEGGNAAYQVEQH